MPDLADIVTAASATTATVTTTSSQIVGPSPYRRVLILTPPPSGAVSYSISPTAVVGRGITLTAGDRPWAVRL